MKTAKILTNQATPGMVVADNVYTFNNQLIISIGTELTDKAITRLKFHSIKQILISIPDETPDPLPIAPFIKDLYSEPVKDTKEFKEFNNTLLNTTAFFKKQLDEIANSNDGLNIDTLYGEINTLISKARNGVHLFDMLHCLRGMNDETYIHSVNVALICNTLARWLNFGKKDIETATLSGLLHDIGKLTMPKELMLKSDKLTKEELDTLRTHAIESYNILKDKDVSIHVKMSAMMHHERCDGSGYPMGIKGAQIDRFAKIVMIADVYDAMTSARVYRGALCPFEVLSMFETEGLTKFEPKYLMTFIEHVYSSYINSTVRLNNKETGIILMMNQNSLTKPVIALSNNTFVDLSKESNLFIEAIL